MVLNQLSFYHYRLSKISKTYENYFYCQHLTFSMLWYFPRNSWIFFHFRVSWYIGMQGETGPNKNFYSTYITTKDLISNFSTWIGYFFAYDFSFWLILQKNCLPQKSNSPKKVGAPPRPYCSAYIKENKNGFFRMGSVSFDISIAFLMILSNPCFVRNMSSSIILAIVIQEETEPHAGHTVLISPPNHLTLNFLN